MITDNRSPGSFDCYTYVWMSRPRINCARVSSGCLLLDIYPWDRQVTSIKASVSGRIADPDCLESVPAGQPVEVATSSETNPAEGARSSDCGKRVMRRMHLLGPSVAIVWGRPGKNEGLPASQALNPKPVALQGADLPRNRARQRG